MSEPRDGAIWTDQLEPRERSVLDQGLPETLELRPDVLVVGGGMLGVSAAVACRAAGAGSVGLIEGGRLGSGATGGAAGPPGAGARTGRGPPAPVRLGPARPRPGGGRWGPGSPGAWGFSTSTGSGGPRTRRASWPTRRPRRNGSPPRRYSGSCRA